MYMYDCIDYITAAYSLHVYTCSEFLKVVWEDINHNYGKNHCIVSSKGKVVE